MKHAASLSLDLDNQWSYMKIHGDAGWEAYPSYLPVVVPRIIDFLRRRAITLSIFIVGKDASIDANRCWLKMLADAGHEICNHSFQHEPWLHLYSREQLCAELDQAEQAIKAATGKMPQGFRGPGFSLSADLLDELSARGYRFDASTFPTFIGPLARAYYFMTARMSKEERQTRGALFGSVKDALRPNKPYWWQLADERELLEIPVSTMPLVRVPFHFSYLIYLAKIAYPLARLYLAIALGLCRLTRTEPSILLHPLDFLGAEDAPVLKFFPGMQVDAETKLQWMNGFFDQLQKHFELLPMGEHASRIVERDRAPRGYGFSR